jgi:SAM-dependent methyltransferase
VSVWAFSALASASESGILDELGTPKTAGQIGERIKASPALTEAVLEVLTALDLVQVVGDKFAFSSGMSNYISALGKDILRGELRATQLLTADLVQLFRGGGASPQGWHYTDPAILEAWGMRSVEQVASWTERLFHSLDGLLSALQAPQARFLDVGTGVGRLSIAMCRQFPNLRVVGIDPFVTAVNLAQKNVAEAELGDRIDLRCEPVQQLTETKSFDLAWVPAMFLSPDSVPEGLHRVREALRPGGWVLLGTAAVEGEGLQPAVLRLMSLLFGGGLLTSKEAAELLEHAGYADVRVLPSSPGVPSRTIVGRRPFSGIDEPNASDD